MLLVLTEEHKEHLKFLATVDVAVVREFCRISMEFIKKGVNIRMYTAAAQKLGVDIAVVRHGVEGLMYLLVESAKLMVNEIDFLDSIVTLGFDEELNKELLSLYQENSVEIRCVLQEMSMDLPHYHDLEWRLEVGMGSRALQQQVEPSLILRLHTKDGDVSCNQVFETDPVNLLHLTKSLESALNELKSQHCRRIMRSIK